MTEAEKFFTQLIEKIVRVVHQQDQNTSPRFRNKPLDPFFPKP